MKHATSSLAAGNFPFEVDVSEWLTARFRKSPLEGQSLDLGSGPELEFDSSNSHYDPIPAPQSARV
jgi:hypothetical protein